MPDITRSWGKLDLPHNDYEAVIVSSQHVFDCFSTLDNSLGSTQSSTDKIRTKLVGSMGHRPMRTGEVPPAKSEVGSGDALP